MAESEEHMKITREINGKTVEIELTEQEMWDVYNAQKVEYAYEDLETWLENQYDDNDEPRPEMDDEDKANIVENYLENKDSEWYEWMEAAVDWVL